MPNNAARASLLVVEDEPILRDVTARQLLDAGYEVHLAENGRKALDMVTSRAVEVDCVISDIVMPQLTGVQLLERLSVSHPQIPVILMSAYDAEHLKGLGIPAPCAYLVKPFHSLHLLQEIERCLEARAA